MALSFDEPFRFVYLDRRASSRVEALVRADDRILQDQRCGEAVKYRGGSIETHFDKKERDAFRKALVADARKAAANYRQARPTPSTSATQASGRTWIRLGRTGACARTQSEDRAARGDIAYTQYLVCAEYRQEAETLKSTGGELSPDKTPLLFLGRAARATRYDFNGVLR